VGEVREQCTFEGCDKPQHGNKLCNGHHKQKKADRELTPLRVIHTNLSDQLDAHTDKTGECWIWIAFKDIHGYGKQTWRGKSCWAYRLAYENRYGPIPKGKHIDHICRNTSCVRPEHLRVATQKQNMENLSVIRAKSGYLGVFRDRKRWRAQVCHNRVLHVRYGFATPEEAAVAVREMRLELFTHNAKDRGQS
jgi:hypothetical protein